MAQLFTLVSFAAHLTTLERDLKMVEHAIIARACEMVCNEAKRVLGTYDYGWPQLKPETIARKMRGDSPLLETGELRASIEWTADGNQGWVGSNNDKAVWHELGTSRVPPRPFLAGAAQHVEHEIHKMAAKAVVAVLAGRGLHSSELMELLHFLKHVYHSVKEDIKEMLPEDENARRR
jgi:phage gpG-like protein